MRATRQLCRCVAGVPGASLFHRTLPCLQHYTGSSSGIFGGDVNESVMDLRHKLRAQQQQKMPRLQTVETESRLLLQLARSAVADERAEALEMGEAMWEELHSPDSSIPFPSRTAMKITLCSALRRCALVSKNRAVAEVWTVRFAERVATISPADFKESSGEVPGWREARAQARPGTGIDADDLEADARDAEATGHGGGGGRDDAAAKPKAKEPSPLEKYRQEKMLEHPVVELAFRRRAALGPRYTG